MQKAGLETIFLARPFNYSDCEYHQRGIDLMAEHIKNYFTRSHPTNQVQARWHVA